MTTNTRRRLAAAVLAGAAALTMAACGSPASKDTTATTPAGPVCQVQPIPGYDQINPCLPEPVMTAAAQRVFSYEPATQESTANSFQAAGPLLDPTYAGEVGASASMLAPVTGATWARWKADGDTVTATAQVTSDEHPADTATSAMRVVAVIQHVIGPNGKPADDDINTTVYMTATRASAASPWLVSMIRPV